MSFDHWANPAPPDIRRHITQGEYAVSGHPQDVITTLLGSCVACCLWDPVAHVGGMNHLLLATAMSDRDAAPSDRRFDASTVAQMEELVNAVLNLGASRMRLQAKLFGGADMQISSGRIGRANAQAVLQYLQTEGIRCEKQSLGGTRGRNIRFWPATGRAQMRLMAEREVAQETPVVRAQPGNEPELF